MPTQTRTNANSVPMLVSSTTSSMLANAGEDRHHDAGQDGGDVRASVLRVDLRRPLRQQAVARHREEDARLAQLEDQQHRGGGEHGAERDDDRRPAACPSAEKAVASGSAVPSCFQRQHAGEDQRHQDVDDGADDQAGDDADRHVALRVLGLLGGRGDGVEADVGEEDDGRGRERPRGSRWARTDASWPVLT